MTTAAPRGDFDSFLSSVLEDPSARASYEDAQTRHRVVDVLVRFRQRMQMTQTDVAKRMGVKQPSVSGFETEGSDPRLSTLQRYARAVDATLCVHVVPNAAAFKRIEYYFDNAAHISFYAQPSEVTPRARSWAGSQPSRYRHHLQAVPDSQSA